MRKYLVILFIGLATTTSAFHIESWVNNLDSIKEDLLKYARINIEVGEAAEDTQDEFELACVSISTEHDPVSLAYFQDLGDTFKIAIYVDSDGDTTNGHDVLSSWIFTREEIEK